MSNPFRIVSTVALIAAASSASAVDLARGQRLYNLHCAACHGMTGIPVMPEAPNLAMRERMNQPDVVLMQSLKMGKKNMPPFFGRLKDQELLDVIQYVRTMR
jgi:cytochrome c6